MEWALSDAGIVGVQRSTNLNNSDRSAVPWTSLTEGAPCLLVSSQLPGVADWFRFRTDLQESFKKERQLKLVELKLGAPTTQCTPPTTTSSCTLLAASECANKFNA